MFRLYCRDVSLGKQTLTQQLGLGQIVGLLRELDRSSNYRSIALDGRTPGHSRKEELSFFWNGSKHRFYIQSNCIISWQAQTIFTGQLTKNLLGQYEAWGLERILASILCAVIMNGYTRCSEYFLLQCKHKFSIQS